MERLTQEQLVAAVNQLTAAAEAALGKLSEADQPYHGLMTVVSHFTPDMVTSEMARLLHTHLVEVVSEDVGRCGEVLIPAAEVLNFLKRVIEEADGAFIFEDGSWPDWEELRARVIREGEAAGLDKEPAHA